MLYAVRTKTAQKFLLQLLLVVNMSIRTSFPPCWPELYNGRGRGWSDGFANIGGIRDIVGRGGKVPNHDVAVI